MKFTKKDVLEKLKQILTEGGKALRASERTLGDLTETLMEAEKENAEMDIDAFVAKYKAIYVSVNGNVEHDVSSGVNEFKTKWEKEHSDTDGGQGGGDKEKNNEGDRETSAAIKALLDRIDALEKTNKEQKAKETVSEKRKSILTKLKEKGIEDDDWSNGMLEQITVDENTDVDSKTEQLLNFYNKTKSPAPAPFTPKTPGGSEPQANNAIALAAQMAKKARADAEAAAE